MLWGDEEPSRAREFAVSALPASPPRSSEFSTTIGITAGAPQVAPVAEGGAHAEVEAQSGSGSWRRRISPHHRDAVKGFFGANEDKR